MVMGKRVTMHDGENQGSNALLMKWLGASALVILLDQLSKLWISSHFAYGESYAVSSILNFVLLHNTGASFNMLSNVGGWQRWLFSGIAIVASVWIIWLLRKHPQRKLFCTALVFILGGALGNLIDRLAYGYVVDFIGFHWDEHHFAVFNLADSAINLGAALLLLDSFNKKPEKNDGSTTR